MRARMLVVVHLARTLLFLLLWSALAAGPRRRVQVCIMSGWVCPFLLTLRHLAPRSLLRAL